jgi:uncharacterized membrane protein
MNPTETPTQTPPAPATPEPASPAPAADSPAVPPAPAADQPPLAPLPPAAPAGAGGKNKMMLYGAIGLVVLVVIIYFLVK